MIPRARLAVAYATGRASHARQVKGEEKEKKKKKKKKKRRMRRRRRRRR
jgi:hypothetical protein